MTSAIFISDDLVLFQIQNIQFVQGDVDKLKAAEVLRAMQVSYGLKKKQMLKILIENTIISIAGALVVITVQSTHILLSSSLAVSNSVLTIPNNIFRPDVRFIPSATTSGSVKFLVAVQITPRYNIFFTHLARKF